MAKKSATAALDLDLDDTPAPKSKKGAAAALDLDDGKKKGRGTRANALIGTTLVIDAEKATKVQPESVRGQCLAAFKGNGLKYETALAKLSTTLEPKRGARAEKGPSEAFAADMIRTMVRLGFLVRK